MVYQSIIEKHKLLNSFSAKYKIISNNIYIPHIRSNKQSSIPKQIFHRFNFNPDRETFVLVKISNGSSESLRVKKISKFQKSWGISLKCEKEYKDLRIEILSINNVDELQSRTEIKDGFIETRSILPKYTQTCSVPLVKQSDLAPIHLFEYDSKIVAHIFMSHKDVVFKNKLEPNELICSVIGLYLTEGGKTQGSFTNSQPKIVNAFLDLIEGISDIKRTDLKAVINCNPEQQNRHSKLEGFWRAQTGITNFYDRLHISENARSKNGILEIPFSSLLKEFLCGLYNLVFHNKDIDCLSVLRGYLSGDGSPIQQTPNTITRHIATDKKYMKFQEIFIEKIAQDRVSMIKTINDNKIVLYNNWQANFEFLFLDPYRYNIFNRKKFADMFLNLPSTKIFLELKNNEMVKGTSTKRRYLTAMESRGDVILHQASPKPYRNYQVTITEKGRIKQDKITDFIRNVYPSYVEDLSHHNHILKKFDLL